MCVIELQSIYMPSVSRVMFTDTKLSMVWCDWAVVPQAQVLSEQEYSTKGAGYTQQLAQLAHQVSLLEKKLHEIKALQQGHAASSRKVCIITLMRTRS